MLCIRELASDIQLARCWLSESLCFCELLLEAVAYSGPLSLPDKVEDNFELFLFPDKSPPHEGRSTLRSAWLIAVLGEYSPLEKLP